MINTYKFLNGAKYFTSDIWKNYLVFIPVNKYFNFFDNTPEMYPWKSNGMSEESIESITKLDNTFSPTLIILFNYNL